MSLSLSQLAQLFLDTLPTIDPRLEDLPVGSTYDALAGATAAVVNEAQIENDLRYSQMFIQTARGQKLDKLATDRFSEDVKRPQPEAASTLVTFYLNAETNSVNIPVGTVVKTGNSPNGAVVRYKTNAPGTLIPGSVTSISLTVTCTQLGAVGNTAANTINEIESVLTSSLVTCNNLSAVVNGKNKYDDGQYREYIYNSIRQGLYAYQLIEAAALTVPGIVFANATELPYLVKVWNGTSCEGDPWLTGRAQLFVGVDGGTPTPEQILAVSQACRRVRADGILLEVYGVIATALDYVLAVQLNPAGPNYTSFVNGDFEIIYNDMRTNMLALPVCNSVNTTVTFDPAAQLLLLTGPGKPYENDFTTVSVVSPAVSVTLTYPADDNKKFIPNLISVVSA